MEIPMTDRSKNAIANRIATIPQFTKKFAQEQNMSLIEFVRFLLTTTTIFKEGDYIEEQLATMSLVFETINENFDFFKQHNKFVRILMKTGNRLVRQTNSIFQHSSTIAKEQIERLQQTIQKTIQLLNESFPNDFIDIEYESSSDDE